MNLDLKIGVYQNPYFSSDFEQKINPCLLLDRDHQLAEVGAVVGVDAAQLLGVPHPGHGEPRAGQGASEDPLEYWDRELGHILHSLHRCHVVSALRSMLPIFVTREVPLLATGLRGFSNDYTT